MNLNESIMKKFNLNQNVIKKTYVFFISFLFLLFSCESDDDSPGVIKVNGINFGTLTSLELTKGDTKDLALFTSVTPSNATSDAVSWKSNKEGKATVSDAGVVTAVSAGDAVITATAKDGSKVFASIEVVVMAEEVEEVVLVEDIRFEITGPIKLTISDTKDLSHFTKVTPSSAADKDVSWVSSNLVAATVDADGEVTALAVGETVITATAGTGTGAVSTSIEIEVVAVETVADILVEDIKFEITGPIVLTVNDTKNLSFFTKVTPSSATDKDVSWVSSNLVAATVDADGEVTALAVGETVITATAGTGTGAVSTSIEIEIVAVETVADILVEDIRFEITGPIVLTISDTKDLSFFTKVTPSSAADKDVSWVSSNLVAATVDADGEVTALAVGETVITATAGTGTGAVSTSIEIEVVAVETVADILVEDIKFEITGPIKLTISDTKDLSHFTKVTPSSAADKDVSWVSSNLVAATVDADGEVTALAVGETVITATAGTGTGAVSTSIEIEVVAVETVADILVEDIKFEITGPIKLTISDTKDLSHFTKVTPSSAADKDVSWVSSNLVAATVDADGEVTALAVGETVITATAGTGTGAVSTSIEIEVVAVETVADILVEDIKFEITGPIKLTISDTKDLSHFTKVTPSSAADKDVSWVSSNLVAATVDADGEVTALAVGETVITATAGTGTGAVSTSIEIEIVAVETVADILVEDIRFEITGPIKLTISDTKDLSFFTKVTPSSAADKDVSWVSSNLVAATVDADGEVTALAVGETVITATAGTGTGAVSTSIEIEVVAVETVADILVEDIKFEITGPIVLTVNDTKNLSFFTKVTPSSATDKDVSWVSSNLVAATVDADGEVTALAVGETVITATAGTGTGAVSTSIEIEVVAVETVADILVEDIKFEITGPIKLTISDTKDLSHFTKVTPSSAADKDVSWVSSNLVAATVDADGEVTALAVGETVITATAGTGTGAVSTSIEIEIVAVETVADILVEDIIFEITGPIKLTISDTKDLSHFTKVTPSSATDKDVSWVSSNLVAATVDADGEVTALAVGETVITATAGTGTGAVSTSIEIEVVAVETVADILVEDIKFEITGPIVLTVNDTKNLSFFTKVTPSSATDKDVSWVSSNLVAATVDADGEVTALAVGETVITATAGTGTGAVSTSIEIEIVAVETVADILVEDIRFEITGPIKLTISDTKDLSFFTKVTPSSAADKDVSWVSSNLVAATVDADGEVTALAVGETVITATAGTGTGAVSTSIEIEVVAVETVADILVEDIKFEITGPIVLTVDIDDIGEKKDLSFFTKVTPSNATKDKTVNWVSSNTDAATVDAVGKVTAVAVGETVITATAGTSPGTVSTSIEVEVVRVDFVTGLQFSSSAIDLILDNEKNLVNLLAVSPPNANQEVIWKSASEGSVTVDSNGKVLAVAAGRSVINAISVENSEMSATITVNVIYTTVENVVIAGGGRIEPGGDVTLSAAVSPSNAEQDVTWAITEYSLGDGVWVVVDDTNKTVAEGIAKVDAGKVTATQTAAVISEPLKVKIQATSKDDLKTSNKVIVIVSYATESIVIDEGDTISREKEATFNLLATLHPLTPNRIPTNVIQKWSSEESNIATVNERSGLLTFISTGETVVRVEIETEGGDTKSDEITVVVYDPDLSDVAIEHNAVSNDSNSTTNFANRGEGVIKEDANLTLTLTLGDTKDLNVLLVPSDAVIEGTVWSTSDSDIVSVNPTTGVVRAEGLAVAGSEVEIKVEVTRGDRASYTSTVKVRVLDLVSTPTPSPTPSPTITVTPDVVVTVNILGSEASNTQLAKSTTTAFTATVSPPNAATVIWAITSYIDASGASVNVADANTADANTGTAGTVAAALIATVNSSGGVESIGKGKVVLTATAGDETSTINIEVVVPVRTIENITSVTSATSVDTEGNNVYNLKVGDPALELSVGYNPVHGDGANAASYPLQWTSNSLSVATVDANGLVTPHTVGTAIITVSTATEDHVSNVDLKKVTVHVAAAQE